MKGVIMDYESIFPVFRVQSSDGNWLARELFDVIQSFY